MARTCVMCGEELKGRASYTAALMLGNKSRDPHVGPYCPNCHPPKAMVMELCLEVCPITGKVECDYSLGPSPIREGHISCIHPDRRKTRG